MAGDYNVVPTDFDIYNPRSWLKDALLQPESRECYQRLLAQGWTDSIRQLHPEERIYTFWDYFRQHWEKNSGLRIDHLLLSESWRRACWRRASTAGCAACRMPATMRRRGSRLTWAS